jgi:hypothetical protein
MPAYIQHHEVETAAIVCPRCIGLLPMYVRDVEAYWSKAKIDSSMSAPTAVPKSDRP